MVTYDKDPETFCPVESHVFIQANVIILKAISSIKMKFKTTKVLAVFLKIGLFLCLFIVFYIYFFSEVAKKYAEENTYLSESQKRMEKIKPPFFTLCFAGPKIKESVLKKYNLSVAALNEPSFAEMMVLKNLNKTIKDFYREATFKLDRDFKLFISFFKYDDNGPRDYKIELNLGDNTKASLRVTFYTDFPIAFLIKISSILI